MFEFTWPRNLRYVTYDCCPLSNLGMVVEIMELADIEADELSERLGIEVDEVQSWLEGRVRPRYPAIDRVAEVCEVDIGPGFGERSPLLADHDDDEPNPFGYPDSDPFHHDRQDMEAMGFMSIGFSDWGSMYPSSRTNSTGGPVDTIVMTTND